MSHPRPLWTTGWLFLYFITTLISYSYFRSIKEVKGQSPAPVCFRIIHKGQPKPVVKLCEQFFPLTENGKESINGAGFRLLLFPKSRKFVISGLGSFVSVNIPVVLSGILVLI